MFKLLDSKGLNSQVIDYSQKNNILVSSVGNTIAMKYINNKPNDEIEVYLKEHKNKILALKFSPCENFLISIDNSVYPEYIIWKIGNEITPIYKDNINIPNTSENNTKFSRFNTNKNNEIRKIKTMFVTKQELTNLTSNKLIFIFVIAINNSNHFYQIQFIINKLCTINTIESFFETDGEILDSLLIHNNSNKIDKKEIKLVVSEKRHIKIFNLCESTLSLITKIQTKQDILPNSLIINENLRIISVIVNGASVIFDYLGKFIMSLSCEYLTNNNDYLLNSLIPQSQNKIQHENFSYQKEFDDKLIVSTNKGSILIYALNGFKLKAFSKYKYTQRIKEKYSLNKIEANEREFEGPDIKYLSINSLMDMIILNYNDNSYFITSISALFGSDISNYLCCESSNNTKYSASVLSMSHFSPITDILFKNENSKTFITSSEDQTLMIWTYKGDKWTNNYFDLLKLIDSSLNYYISYEIPSKEQTHDTKSYLTCLRFSSKYSNLLIASNSKGKLFVFELNENEITLCQKSTMGNFSISNFEISPSGSYLILTFVTGLSYLCDFNNNFKVLLTISNTIDESNNQIVFSSQFIKKSYSDESFRIIVYKNNSTLKICSISKNNSKYNMSVLSLLSFDNLIEKYLIHPGQNYIVSLHNNNQINISRLESGSKSGVIQLPGDVKNIKFDPSGLYMCCLLNFDSLVFYEFGTGKMLNTLDSCFKISNYSFSSDGRFIIISSESGSVTIWQNMKEMRDNIINILTEMKLSNNFWDMFIIEYSNQLKQMKDKCEEEIPDYLEDKIQDYIDYNKIYSKIKEQNYSDNKMIASKEKQIDNKLHNSKHYEVAVNDNLVLPKTQENPAFDKTDKTTKSIQIVAETTIKKQNINSIENNININYMQRFEPKQQSFINQSNQLTKFKEEIKEDETERSLPFFTAIELQPEYIKQIINRKNYFIKNKNTNNSKSSKLTDPSDIDLLDSVVYLQHPFNAKQVEKKINNISNTNEVSYIGNKGNTTDEIEFAYDNIYKFDKRNNLNIKN